MLHGQLEDGVRRTDTPLPCAFCKPHLQFCGELRQDAFVTNGGVYGARYGGSDQEA